MPRVWRSKWRQTYTGLFEMIVGVLTTCHAQYTWDRNMCIFLFNRTTLPVFVTYRTGALYVHPLWFYRHQHDNPVRSKLFVACQRWLSIIVLMSDVIWSVIRGASNSLQFSANPSFRQVWSFPYISHMNWNFLRIVGCIDCRRLWLMVDGGR